MNWFVAPGSLWRYAIAGVAALGTVLLAGFLWIVLGPGPLDFAKGRSIALAAYHSSDPTGVPPGLRTASLVKRGEYLARAADCQPCHTGAGGAPFSGGRALVTPFGTIYSPNITADRDTGIGAWTDAQFLDTIHRGIGAGGKHLYPAMPYTSYAGMTDADALAIKAYLFSSKPVHAVALQNSLTFPFDQRWLMGIWSLLFNSDERFEPNPLQSAQWNRGAYLAESLGHCGECHTPRTLFQSLNNRRKFAGATQAGWRAYNITAEATSGIGSWSDAQLEQYLATGHAEGHGTAAGPMGEAIDNSLAYLAKNDINDIVSYLRSVPAITTPDLPVLRTAPAPASHREGVVADYDLHGKRIFEGACASCHDWTGVSSVTPMATLTGARALNDPSAINVAEIVLNGTLRTAPGGAAFMPAFGSAYSNVEIAEVANYVVARFGAAPSRIAAKDVAKLRKEN